VAAISPSRMRISSCGLTGVDLTRCVAILGPGKLTGLGISNPQIHCTAYVADHELFAVSFLFLQGNQRTQWTLVYYPCYSAPFFCPEGARGHGATDGWHYACDPGSGAPSGLFSGEIRFPGLKPWAESYSPFGARVAGATLNTSQTERSWSCRRSLAL
jgi:hypothetical protein